MYQDCKKRKYVHEFTKKKIERHHKYKKSRSDFPPYFVEQYTIPHSIEKNIGDLKPKSNADNDNWSSKLLK